MPGQDGILQAAGRDEPAAVRPPERYSVRGLCDKFLDRTREAKGEDTFRVQLGYLKAFCKPFGQRPSDALKVHEVNEWLDKTAWGGSTKALAVQVVKSVFNWAVSEDYLAESPLKKLRRRQIARRERVLSTEEQRDLLKGAAGEFRDFLTVLLKTGMRPFSEAAPLTAAMIDWEQGRAVLKRHKNAKKGKVRVVYFAPEVVDILRRLAAKYPDGPLFRNNRGTIWKKDSTLERAKRICADAGLDRFNVYALRSTWITDALIRGVPVEVVAELAGTSAKMIHKHYASIDKKADALRDAAAKAVG